MSIAPQSVHAHDPAAVHPSMAAVLKGIKFSYDGGSTWALDNVDITIHTGERVCLIGRNGSGKSTLARLIAGLTAPDAGDVTLLGQHVFDADSGMPHSAAYRAARHGIGAVFQNPEDQIVTTVTEDDVAFGPENLGLAHAEIGTRIAGSLNAVDMEAQRYADPTRMSGGQQQRIAIAGMLAMNPAMLVLDEPTAMLDPIARAEVMRILDALQARGTTIVHVTHHMDETAHADRVIELDHGRVVRTHMSAEQTTQTAQTAQITENASIDDDTNALGTTAMSADSTTVTPSTSAWSSSTVQPMIQVDHVSYHYPDASLPALDDASLKIRAGETVAIMGSNGAGKSTLARLICALEKPDSGSITVAGLPVATARTSHFSKRVKRSRPLRRKQREALRREVGFVMQHPERQLFATTVAEDIAYGPRNQGLSDEEVRQRVDHALELLHITHIADRSPFDLSGGQQRLAAIAGVIACQPRVLVMDEPTASLDMQATARIHALIRELKQQGVTIVIITHSLDEAHALADRVIDMTPPAHTNIEPPAATQSAPQSAPQSDTPGRLSPIASLDPRVKMTMFLVLMFTAFAISTPLQLAFSALLAIGIVAAARLNPLRLLARVHMFFAMFVIMGLINVFFVRTGDTLVQLGSIPITTGGVTIAILYICRFALVIILGAVFLDTTTPTAMTDAFGSLLSPLARLGMHTQEIALVMSLALRFLPTLGAEAKAIVDAQAARGGSVETGSPVRRIRAMAAIIVPVFAGALRHADNLSLALDARCYEEGARRTHWRLMRVRRRDLTFIALCAAYVIALTGAAML
ncbi:cobalt ABC transporter [Bifidobacterium goeldii]|uniref:Cobalt ABC transporter n=1 Tax=Bifidobacterium goeldii TaxID=2306975 RepID=A0A430FJV4_9BIFI|nr:energy-coupling factor transporter ATPase [Bifidobacterium goeldii]RSX53174.1 cobalt ABC transporter [Bifidobacterium goeldii]